MLAVVVGQVYTRDVTVMNDSASARVPRSWPALRTQASGREPGEQFTDAYVSLENSTRFNSFGVTSPSKRLRSIRDVSNGCGMR
jgi:hypothetical protein